MPKAMPVRQNQRLRTRKDLLSAAARLVKSGRTPDMDAVAAEAMVSRATAYRYFPSIDALLVELPLDIDAPEPEKLFENESSTDPLSRIDKAEATLHEMTYRNEAQLRMMLIASLQRKLSGETQKDIPLRQNRRGPLIDAALAPVRKQIKPAQYETLKAALSLIFGTESMIVCTDVLNLDKKTARKVKSWAVQTLVKSALETPRAK